MAQSWPWVSQIAILKKKKQGKWVEKNVFAVYHEEMTLEMAIESLKTSLANFYKLIYTANYQWYAHSTLRNNLNESSVITVEDYQMNIEVEFTENPTSLVYSTNKLSYALYSTCVEYQEDGIVKKSAVSFISSDKKYDQEQIQKFEQRLFEIRCEKVHPGIKKWACFSDNCSAQFKSWHCVADLFNNIGLLKLLQASFHYFESHEGKNSSDSIGSTNKCHFLRAMLKNLNITARTADGIVIAVRERKEKR